MHSLTRANRSISSPYPRASSLAAVPDELRDQLNALHADELAYLSQQWRRRNSILQVSLADVDKSAMGHILPPHELSIAAFAFVSSWIAFFLFRAKGFSLINATYPGMFEELTHEQLQAAGVVLAKPIHGLRGSSIWILPNYCKLQCSALMYERTSAPFQDALLSAILGPDAASEVNRHLHTNPEEDALAAFAHRLRYNAVSELNSQASALCGMFWDPESTWIILAYKGTSPTEFVEWTTDFSFTPRDVGHWIRGWGRAHGGFVDKIFPRKIKPSARLPYGTIRQAVKTVSRHLLANKPEGTEINVWTTGHSLGCALALLVYARQINEPRDLGHNVVVRDAYLFAAPILCVVDSVNAFNNRMNHGADSPRTMWRITNGLDVVARSLSNFGDYSKWSVSPYNLFSYAHIGAEIQPKRSPECSIVGGESHITPGSHIRIVSTLMGNVTLLGSDAESRKAQAQLVWAQKLPLIGRIFAHGTASYWIALNEVRTGRVEWEDS
ncbi:alpha/beta-hydrolase [Hysterangium stoloniferum]|nr:alpha/beta-hydrolase [Hysterangium stoloniferum]